MCAGGILNKIRYEPRHYSQAKTAAFSVPQKWMLAAATVYRGQRERGRSALPPSNHAVGRKGGGCSSGEATFGLLPLPRLARGAPRSPRGARAARRARKRARGSHRGSPRRTSPGRTAPLGPAVNFRLRPAFPCCETSLGDAAAEMFPSLACLYTRTHARIHRQSC